MAQYKKVNGHYEVLPETLESDTVDENNAQKTMNKLGSELGKVKDFIQHDAPTDYIVKLYIPKYYNDGTKVSPDVIAEIMAKISETIGGASTWTGKGYWIDNDLLYEDKNVYVETILSHISPERAISIARYLTTVIANALKQEGGLVVVVPALSEYIGKHDYEKIIKESEDDINKLNTGKVQQSDNPNLY
jgi:hypothetical protein